MPHQSYIATFPAGCFEIISRKLKEFSMQELKILLHDESSVVFNTTLRQERLIEFRFFTNVYMIIDTTRFFSIKHYLKGDSYRLMSLVNGTPSAIIPEKNGFYKERLEKDLGLRSNIARHSNDFVVIKRGDEKELFTLKLSRAKHKRANPPPGALRPELAHILLLVAGAKPKDVLLDPFSGYGSIPTEAAQGFGLKQVKAVEKNAALVKRDDVFIGTVQGDAKNLDFIDGGSVDKIVTDPPWGTFQKMSDEEMEVLYKESLNEMHRVLKPHGIAVILSGSEILNRVITERKDFEEIKSFHILVSGQKATIHKLLKV